MIIKSIKNWFLIQYFPAVKKVSIGERKEHKKAASDAAKSLSGIVVSWIQPGEVLENPGRKILYASSGNIPVIMNRQRKTFSNDFSRTSAHIFQYNEMEHSENHHFWVFPCL